MRQSLLLTSALLLAASASTLSDEVDSPSEPPAPEPPRPGTTSQWTSEPQCIDAELLIPCRKCQAQPYIDCDQRTLGRHRFHLCRVQDAAALAATGAA